MQLSLEVGITPKAAAKWRKPVTVEDVKTGPKKLFIGLGTIVLTLEHMDGSIWSAHDMSQNVVIWNPTAWAGVVDAHWLYKAHIFLRHLITMLFPFTRLVRMSSGFAAPFGFLLRSGYQIVRSGRQ